jgi:DNA topoisomerase-1
MNLVVVESPTKAKTLANFLGKDFSVVSSMGHVRDLPKSKLGVATEQGFLPQYEIAKGKKKVVSELKKAAAGAETLFLATDPDREGEAIAWHVAQILQEADKKWKTSDGTVKRVVFHEITKDAVEDSFKQPRELNLDLVDSQQARRVLDRLVGYSLSPLLWKKVRYGLSAGRVQSVAVFLIVKREREREQFQPEEYWEVKAQLRKPEDKEHPFEANLISKKGEKIAIGNEEAAQKILGDLEGATYQVADLQKSTRQRRPRPPFTTSTLQQAAVNLLGFSAKRTMRAAQRLYEAGLITYHRTDSTFLAKKAITEMRSLIGEKYGEEYLPKTAPLYKTKVRLAQEAHEAVRPTSVGLEPGDERLAKLGKDERNLYPIIWGRTVACQMSPAVYEQVRAEIAAGDYLFRANGSKLLFDGWLRALGGEREDRQLPELGKGDGLELLELMPSQHFTEPPPRYTEATLIKALEEEGIGRPSTYAPTISTIQDRGYVVKEGRQLRPEDVGVVVNDLLVGYFPNIVDLSFTAKMEDELDKVADGKKEWPPVIEKFYQPFAEDLAEAEKSIDKSSVTTLEETDENCPDCGKPLIIKLGRYGRFYSCSAFPECKFTKAFVETIGMNCPDCKEGEVIVKRTRRGKIFYGCSRYPKCKWASWNDPRPKDKKRNKNNER